MSVPKLNQNPVPVVRIPVVKIVAYPAWIFNQKAQRQLKPGDLCIYYYRAQAGVYRQEYKQVHIFDRGSDGSAPIIIGKKLGNSSKPQTAAQLLKMPQHTPLTLGLPLTVDHFSDPWEQQIIAEAQSRQLSPETVSFVHQICCIWYEEYQKLTPAQAVDAALKQGFYTFVFTVMQSNWNGIPQQYLLNTQLNQKPVGDEV